jgi:hypothetical protein
MLVEIKKEGVIFSATKREIGKINRARRRSVIYDDSHGRHCVGRALNISRCQHRRIFVFPQGRNPLRSDGVAHRSELKRITEYRVPEQARANEHLNDLIIVERDDWVD